ncbi:hypothetical protein ACFPVY_16235 [Flavobacterium qiangtangense]|uniref:Uncharacterized protein n=1 Tax=Flavobacterium qiangtangense TaxID=1442595 RepID=A0ABW1PT71_9FLAO
MSKPISIKDLEDVKNDIVKRDIVYVAFQTFALTDVNELTVTAVPSELENQKKYFDTYRKSLKIDREKARFVLKKYIGTENFQSLYKMEGTIWIPSDNFSVLKFEKLKDVFEDLQK